MKRRLQSLWPGWSEAGSAVFFTAWLILLVVILVLRGGQ